MPILLIETVKRGDGVALELEELLRKGNRSAEGKLVGGADINDVDHAGRTALITAAANGSVELVKVLLKVRDARGNASNVHLKDKSGSPALIRAVRWDRGRGVSAEAAAAAAAAKAAHEAAAIAPADGLEEAPELAMVKRLLAAGASVNVHDLEGKTALAWAAELGQAGMVELLRERGAELDKLDADGRTPLMHACVNGANEASIPTVRQLLRGAPLGYIDARDRSGLTALMHAMEAAVAACRARSAARQALDSARLEVSRRQAAALQRRLEGSRSSASVIGAETGADAGAESAAELLLSPRSKENWEKTSRAIRRASLFKIQQGHDDEQRARQALSKPIAPSKPVAPAREWEKRE